MIELNCIKSLNGANGKFDLDVNLNVKKGEFVALYGKSGSGKIGYGESGRAKSRSETCSRCEKKRGCESGCKTERRGAFLIA